MNKKVEIFIACHKLSYLPKNDLFVPIHVGAEKSKIKMPIQRDDEGDNISAKNPHYCEMTAQYWAFRHSDADYIGLCHYRRFLSFCDEQFTTLSEDNRKQVIVPKLTAATAARYGLTNRQRMLEKLENCDIAVPRPMDLSMVYTPKGKQKSVLLHWLAHDRAFFRESDLRKMYALVRKYYPSVYPDLVEYMNGKYFYGYNTFVMRKDLFREMSAFEFDILSRLEQRTDLSGYSTMANRIYGFMGEILYSAYIYHLKKSRPDLKILECQMLYFEDTEPEQVIAPAFPEDKNPVQVVIDLEEMPGFMAETALQTLLSNRSPERFYDVLLLSWDKTSYYRDYFQKAVQDDNVRIRIISPAPVIDELSSLYGKADCGKRGDRRTGYSSQVFLPWILKNWDKCLYLKWNVLVNHPVDEIYDKDLCEAGMAGAADVVYMGRLSSWLDNERNYVHDVLKAAECPVNMIQTEVMVMNLSLLRRQNLPELAHFMKEACRKKGYTVKSGDGVRQRIPTGAEVFAVALSVPWTELPQKKVHCLKTDQYTIQSIEDAPAVLSTQYKAVKDADIDVFPEEYWWKMGEDPGFFVKYWKIVDASPLKELFHERREKISIREELNSRGLTESVKRASLKLLPYGSKQRETFKAVYCRARDML